MLILLPSLWLPACGGGGSDRVDLAAHDASVASGTTTVQMNLAWLPDDVGVLLAQPMFHTAPALLAEPSRMDASDNRASAHSRPHQHRLAVRFDEDATRRLTLQEIEAGRRLPGLSLRALAQTSATPMALNRLISIFTPAQIRAAYDLPALPAVGAAISTAQAAALGAGQTIYIIAAQHNPNAAAELLVFNQTFGLPVCAASTLDATSSLPLPAASLTACELLIAFSTASGALSSTTPAYDADWATEIALDIQWAHATAPLARLVLLESGDAMLSSLIGAVKLANRMGPGVVSMSFGAPEGNWTASVEPLFSHPGMSYLAASGDSGAGVFWPSVSPNVLAVGGTTLEYSGTGARAEVAWSSTGGGLSGYTAAPSYQNANLPGMGFTKRFVADVAFNADPASGQYVVVLTPGSSTPRWLSIGGTSLATPQWAGLLAVSNALRAFSAKPVLVAPHTLLYGLIASLSDSLFSLGTAFYDVTEGSHGSCSLCFAKPGYDAPTGLGTPNGKALLAALRDQALVAAPRVDSAVVSGMVGLGLTFTASVASPNSVTNPLSFFLSGQLPDGLSVDSSGVLRWPTPQLGNYAALLTALDAKTGLSGQGTYRINIAPTPAPQVISMEVLGDTKLGLSFPTSVVAFNPLSYSLADAPAGMVVNRSSGQVSWPLPLAGRYVVTLSAFDSRTGLTGSGVYRVAISMPLPPVVRSATVNAKPDTALAFQVAASASNPLLYSLGDAPAGMAISSAGVLSWAKPVLGSVRVTVTAVDSQTGLSGQGFYTVITAVAGPVITAPAMTGLAGQPITGLIRFTDPAAPSLLVSISGVPLGMTFAVLGQTITVTWNQPVKADFVLNILALDSAGLMARAVLPISILSN